MIKKEHGTRLPIESNLLLSVLFRMFEKVDPRIARHFKVLNHLIGKVEARTFFKSDFVFERWQKFDKIMFIN